MTRSPRIAPQIEYLSVDTFMGFSIYLKWVDTLVDTLVDILTDTLLVTQR